MHLVRRSIRAVLLRLASTLRKQHELPEPERAPLLDPATCLFPGDLGIVGSPKFEDAEAILLSIAIEMAPHRDVLIVVDDRHRAEIELLALASGISAESIECLRLTPEERQHLQAVRERIEAEPIELMNASQVKLHLHDLRRWLENHPNGLAVLPAAWPASLVDEANAATFVRDLKTIARETDAAIVLPWWLRHRVERELMLKDLAGTGAAEEDTDMVLLVGHDVGGDIEELRIAKNRHGDCRTIWRADPADIVRAFLPKAETSNSE